MKPKQFLGVKDFREFQHYRDRDPIWIKLYMRLLEDSDFESLPDTAKAHLMLIWLLAARTDDRIPYDAAWVRAKIGANTRVDLDDLVARGWLYVRADSASNSASSRASGDAINGASGPASNGASTPASPRALARGEKRREEKRRGGPASVPGEHGDDAAQLLVRIRGFVVTTNPPGQAARQILPRDRVASLGDDVLTAFDAIGGRDRILQTEAKHYGFLARDFAEQLAAARRLAPARAPALEEPLQPHVA